MQDDQEISNNYMDLVTQFGYVAMFSTVFPLTPLMMLGFNWLTLKAIYLEFEFEKRSMPEVSIGIGKNLDMIDLLQFVSVIVNCALIYFTNNSTERFITNRFFDDLDAGTELVYFLLLVIFVEHFIILVRMLLAECIEDKDRFFEKKRLNNIHTQAHEAK